MCSIDKCKNKIKKTSNSRKCSKHDEYNNYFCVDHSRECISCGYVYCDSHITSHYATTHNNNGFVVELYCCDNKTNGKYEGQWIDGKKTGCGVFTWPSGLTTMCFYNNNGELIFERDFSEEAIASMIVKEKMDQWEKIKIEKEKNLKDSLEKELSEQRSQITAEITKEQEKIKQGYKDLELQKSAFEKEQIFMKKFTYDQNSLVKLNVGGKIFETTIATLTKYPSMLQSMFSGKYENKLDKNGCIFIDADGELFGTILNFLRRGILPTSVDKKSLLAEAEYYSLDVLISALQK